jgi:long-chain acyl-CoA synthetase
MEYSEYKKIAEDYHLKFARYNRIKKAFLKRYFRYFHRLEVIGRENIPEGPALLAPNHPGGMELDIFALGNCIFEHREITTLVVEYWHFMNHAWGRWYVGGGIPLWTTGGLRYEFIDPYLKGGGENYPGLVCLYPEGNVPHFRDRNKVFKFFPGVVRLAIHYRIPIVPVVMVNFSEACPVIKIYPKKNAPQDILCLPFAFPLKLKIEFGKPVYLDDFYGREFTKAEEYWIANEVVKPEFVKLRQRHNKIDVMPVDVEMRCPFRKPDNSQSHSTRQSFPD